MPRPICPSCAPPLPCVLHATPPAPLVDYPGLENDATDLDPPDLDPPDLDPPDLDPGLGAPGLDLPDLDAPDPAVPPAPARTPVVQHTSHLGDLVLEVAATFRPGEPTWGARNLQTGPIVLTWTCYVTSGRFSGPHDLRPGSTYCSAGPMSVRLDQLDELGDHGPGVDALLATVKPWATVGARVFVGDRIELPKIGATIAWWRVEAATRLAAGFRDGSQTFADLLGPGVPARWPLAAE